MQDATLQPGLYGIANTNLQLATINSTTGAVTPYGENNSGNTVSPQLSAIDYNKGIFYSVKNHSHVKLNLLACNG
jgi:hypothetical protein